MNWRLDRLFNSNHGYNVIFGLAEVRFQDYRDVPETDFDAISSIGITEHIGKANVDGYFKFHVGNDTVRLDKAVAGVSNIGPTIATVSDRTGMLW